MMKMPNLLLCLLMLAVLCGHSLAAVPVAFRHTTTGDSKDDVGQFVFEVMQMKVSENANYELVHRDKLSDVLEELQLGAAGITNDQAVKLGNLVGAKYLIFGSDMSVAGNQAVNCRVIQVSTGVFKPVLATMVKDEDPMNFGARLAAQVITAIVKLEGRQSEVSSTLVSKFEIPKGAALPAVAIRVPESSATKQMRPDPAAEKTLEVFLQTHAFKLVKLSKPSQAVSADSAVQLESEEHEKLLSEAREKGVGVLILGAATSDISTRIGGFTAARARVELSLVSTSDSRILASGSQYGTGTDVSDFVAEKKAIEAATKILQESLMKEWAEKLGQ